MHEKSVIQHGDSDSGQSPSDHEKGLGETPIDAHNRDITDPDEHLSEEERKKNVGRPYIPKLYWRVLTLLVLLGTSLALETRSQPDPLAMYASV